MSCKDITFRGILSIPILISETKSLFVRLCMFCSPIQLFTFYRSHIFLMYLLKFKSLICYLIMLSSYPASHFQKKIIIWLADKNYFKRGCIKVEYRFSISIQSHDSVEVPYFSWMHLNFAWRDTILCKSQRNLFSKGETTTSSLQMLRGSRLQTRWDVHTNPQLYKILHVTKVYN